MITSSIFERPKIVDRMGHVRASVFPFSHLAPLAKLESYRISPFFWIKGTLGQCKAARKPLVLGACFACLLPVSFPPSLSHSFLRLPGPHQASEEVATRVRLKHHHILDHFTRTTSIGCASRVARTGCALRPSSGPGAGAGNASLRANFLRDHRTTNEGRLKNSFDSNPSSRPLSFVASPAEVSLELTVASKTLWIQGAVDF
jgi:hypothetical protein